MDILLSRILAFLNGTLFYDDSYIFCTWIVKHYSEMYDTDFTPERIMRETGISRSSIDDFVAHLGKDWKWDDFLVTLQHNHETRLDQIRSRMIGLTTKEIVHGLEKNETDEEMLEYVSKICEVIDKSERIFLIGAHYPISVASEFQTDLITYGKNVIAYHHYDPTVHFTEKDLIIFVSATGRSLKGFLKNNGNKNPQAGEVILITQNPIYKKEEYKISDWVIQMPGRYDGININYQLMTIFDLLRLHYYQQYFIGHPER
ncbi:MAG: MurR/RpiR family transcriptional regulator [Firmicutes bacterium]|nr:MurR/RpiR family transcriptional regulator [Bacillota bacterium]